MSHVVAQALVDQGASLRVFRVSRRFGSVLVADVLHDRDMLGNEETIVIQNRNFLLRIQLRQKID